MRLGKASSARLRAAKRRIAALEGRLAEMARQLDLARAEGLAERQRADEARAARSAFLSNMSHELRTPLNAVLGFAQLMARNPALEARDRENLAAITRGGEHLLGIVNDVLSLSRLESGHLASSPHEFDLVRLVRGVEDVIRSRAEVKGLALDVVLQPDLPECVFGDEDKLRQVLMHLLGNAVECTESGGVTLRSRWGDGVATFEVEDTGRGIAPADMGVLFEAFVQAQSGLPSNEGAGLGLALSRNLVLVMDGDIFASSELGKGTVFVVEVPLPSVPCTRRVPWRRVAGLEPGQGPFRVLVADDSQEARALLGGQLAAVGFDVREASNGREAVDVWRAWRPHMIWMDARMGTMDGYEATRIIRSAEGTRGEAGVAGDGGASEGLEGNEVLRAESFVSGLVASQADLAPRSSATPASPLVPTRIVALTTAAFAHEREVALGNGADDFKIKPVSERDVFVAVAEHLGVRYLYEGAPELSRVAPTVTPERLAAHPGRVLAQLSRALTIGDDRLAREIIAWIGSRDPELAGELDRMVREFRFDDLSRLIESIPPESR